MSSHFRTVALDAMAAIASAIRQVRAVVLLYHSVSGAPSEMTVPTRAFGEQLRYMTDHFELLPVSKLLARLAQGADHSHPLAALTFDDGYADSFDQVLPILALYQVCATFYPITGLLGQHYSDSQGQEMRMLSWEQLSQMAGQGHEIGAHTVHHFKLHQLPVEEARREVYQGKSDLEARLNVPVQSFAYPRGRYTPVVKELVRAAGFTNAVTIHEGTLGSVFDPFELPRVPVQPDTSLAAFRARTTTAIDWYARLRRRRRGA